MGTVTVKKALLWRAVREKCLECMGEDTGRKWAIGNCTCEDCPLYPLRPYQHLKNTPPQGVYKLDTEDSGAA